MIITDPYGEEINRLKGGKKAGINKIVWNMRHKPTEEEVEQRKRSPFRFRGPAGKLASPGEYVIVLKVGEKELSRKNNDPEIRTKQSFPGGEASHTHRGRKTP